MIHRDYRTTTTENGYWIDSRPTATLLLLSCSFSLSARVSRHINIYEPAKCNSLVRAFSLPAASLDDDGYRGFSRQLLVGFLLQLHELELISVLGSMRVKLMVMGCYCDDGMRASSQWTSKARTMPVAASQVIHISVSLTLCFDSHIILTKHGQQYHLYVVLHLCFQVSIVAAYQPLTYLCSNVGVGRSVLCIVIRSVRCAIQWRFNSV